MDAALASDTLCNNEVCDLLYASFLETVMQCGEYRELHRKLASTISLYQFFYPNARVPLHLRHFLESRRLPTQVQLIVCILACKCDECDKFIETCDLQ